jgi:hypothetical protein
LPLFRTTDKAPEHRRGAGPAPLDCRRGRRCTLRHRTAPFVVDRSCGSAAVRGSAAAVDSLPGVSVRPSSDCSVLSFSSGWRMSRPGSVELTILPLAPALWTTCVNWCAIKRRPRVSPARSAQHRTQHCGPRVGMGNHVSRRLLGRRTRCTRTLEKSWPKRCSMSCRNAGSNGLPGLASTRSTLTVARQSAQPLVRRSAECAVVRG